ncbi:MAG: YdcF family protein [Bacteroidota bacterium]
MFFLISKILYFLLCPLTWILILLIVAVLIRKPKLARKYYITTLVFFIFFTNPAIIDELLRLWEQPMTMIHADQQFEAGIVLGGGMVTIDKDYDRLIFQNNTDRILQTLDLYKKGTIKKIIICGGPGTIVFKETIEGILLKRYLTEIGVPKDDIYIDSTSNNTHENAVNCADIINKNFTKRSFLLITSAIHMKRAQDCFSKQGICTTAYPVSKIVGYRRTDIGYYLMPDAEVLIKWDKYLHEVFGYVTYTVMGYI